MAAPTRIDHDLSTTAVLSEHRDYLGAQRDVDRLSDAGFPVEHLTIVGRDLVTIEDVTGRRRYGRAALSGAATGAFLGLFLGLVFSLLAIFPTLVSFFAMIVTWIAIGAIGGALAGLIGHAMQGGERDFSSTRGLLATRYEVLVEAAHHERAARELQGTA